MKIGLVSMLFLVVPAASAQSGQWITFGHDPQRSGYASDEHAFSPSNLSSLGLVWKTIVPNKPRSLNGLTAPLLVGGVKTSSGLRNIVIVGASSDHLYGIDAETGDLLWKSDFVEYNATPYLEGRSRVTLSVAVRNNNITTPGGDVEVIAALHLYYCLISYTTPAFVCPPNGVVP
jgi:PQQ enzyme repeat